MSIGIPRSWGPGSRWCWPPVMGCAETSVPGTDPLRDWLFAIEFNETDPDSF